MIDQTITTGVRPFTTDDYDGVLAVHNAVLPDYPETVEDWRHWDSSRPAHCICERYVVERGGKIVAFGHIDQSASMYHPRKFHMDIKVHPAVQGQGIGAGLYEHLLGRLAARDAIVVRTEIREDWNVSVGFVQRRGFVEGMRVWESRLDVMAFDPAPFASHEQRVQAQGVEIISLRDLIEREPNHRYMLYEAITELLADVPRPDPYTRPDFESWEQQVFSDKNLYPEGYFLAMRNGEIAAVSQLWRTDRPDLLQTGLTATRRNHRRLGLALALKLRAIAFAKERGVREIRTANASINQPMLSINEALGFVKQPAWIEVSKTLKAE